MGAGISREVGGLGNLVAFCVPFSSVAGDGV